MAERSVPIAPREFELSQSQQRVGRSRRQRIINHDVFIIAFGVSRARGETRAPEQSLWVQWR
jgi:hypothetical protein